ncbi:MAG TPA: hypothetical protein VGU01_11725 [Sphingomicrobium sp.]|nr:hypothetical protein [Sphingomicrobium sp.]
MLKLLVGPLLVGTGYAAGSYYGSDAEQVVHKDPSFTYAAVNQAVGNIRPTGETSFDGGTPFPYEIRVDRTPGEKLQIHLIFAGKQGAEADISFMPVEGGHDTLMRTQIHAERSVLRSVLAGTERARLAYAPDWMLNLSFRPLLQQIVRQIEQGEIAQFEDVSPGEAQAQWEANLGDQERAQLAEWRQYQATQPAVDPEAAAQKSMDRKDD